MRALSRLAGIGVVTFALCGCIEGPKAPGDRVTDGYMWRVPLGAEGDDSVYRFILPDDLTTWMSAHKTGWISVFDATGNPQTCGPLSGIDGPLGSISVTYEGRVEPFEANVCATHDDAPACFAGSPCPIAAGCPHATIDLSKTSLAGLDSLSDLVAIANVASDGDACTVAQSHHAVSCGALDGDRGDVSFALRRDARHALAVAGLGRLLAPEPPRVVTRPGQMNPGAMGGAVRSFSGAGAILSGPGSSQPSPLRPPLPDRTSPAETEPDGGFLVTFDEPASKLMLSWEPPPPPASRDKASNQTYVRPGTLRTIVYDAAGKAKSQTSDFSWAGRMPGGHLVLSAFTAQASRTIRVIPEGNASDYTLVGASWTRTTAKPFIDGKRRQFWFAAAGTPPYAIYLEPGHGFCGANEGTKFDELPRVHDPDWPREATVGALAPNSRRPLGALAAEHYDWFVWSCWLAGMIALWLVGAGVVAARWLIQRQRADRQRRS